MPGEEIDEFLNSVPGTFADPLTNVRPHGSAEGKLNARGTSTRRKIRRRSPPRFVVCINNANYPASLELHKIYRVLPDEEAAREGNVRVIDESGEDYLYPADWFVPVEVPQAVKSSLLRAS